MKRLTPIWASALVAIMVFSGLLPLTMNVVAAVPIPHNMYGFPYDETGVRMDVGERITAWIDGVEYGRNDTWPVGPDIYYDVDIDGNHMTAPLDPNTPWVKEGGDFDEHIMLAWGDMTMIDLDPEDDSILNYGIFEEVDLWMTANVTNTDINLAMTQPPMFPKISMIVPEPTDGWPDYVLIYTERPFFDMTGFYLEKNDGVLNGPSFVLSGLSNATAYFYANLTTMDNLDACGDELKLVWSNTATAFSGYDIVVDRVEWNATTGGTHNVGLNHEPDNTIMTDAAAPACAVTDFAMRRDGVFPVFDTDTNDNLADFVVDTPWPRPVIGAPVVNILIPAGGEDWTGGSVHDISWTLYDDNFINSLLTVNVSYNPADGMAGFWFPAVLNTTPMQDFPGWFDALTPMEVVWTLPFTTTPFMRIQVCAINPAGKSTCVVSLAFETDDTPPTVISTDPIYDDKNVPIDRTVVITFDEPMNTTSVEGAISIWPGGVTITGYGWDPTNEVLSIYHTDFLENTTYCVNTSTGAKDDSDPGYPMAQMNSTCFTTYEPKAPTISVTYPDGGQIWTGDKPKNIWFSFSHVDGLDLTYVWLNYSCGGPPDYVIDGARGDDARWTTPPYVWTVPLIDATDCVIHATIQDLDDHLVDNDTSPTFIIDSTPPTAIEVPPGPIDNQENVTIGTNVVVEFSEPMDNVTVEDPATWWMRTGTTVVTGTFSWDPTFTTVTFDPDSDLAYFLDYTVTINTTAKDPSDPGNFLAADYTFNFITEHSPPPIVAVLFPDGSESPLKADDTLFIEWLMSDVDTPTADLKVDVSYVFDTTTLLIIELEGELNHTWTVSCPQLNADTAIQIQVEVTDAEGQTTSNVSVPVMIDCTIPTANIVYTGDLLVNEVIQFNTADESETNLTYSWDLDGDTVEDSTLKNPTFQYGTAGTFIVRLTVTDEAGNSGTVTPVTLEIEAPVTPTDDRIFGIELWMWIIIIIVIVMIIALIALAAKRKKKEPEEELPPAEEEEEEELVEEEEEVYEEEEAPAEEEEELVEEEETVEEKAAPVAAAAPAEEAPATEEEPAGATKECPSCGSEVPVDATECFLCGATL
ncbi:MAG: PKD domain-containing protein [Methanomassiliicoccales archaeon]|nr:MAG: PKD domain-containing protein [Methanomassiliicoccales archaeon]